MTGAAVDRRTIGRELYQAGWRQGSLFIAPDVRAVGYGLARDGQTVERSERPLRSRERFVVVSQDCDIIAPGGDEPYVDALLCTVEKDAEYLARAGRNSARLFLIDPSSGLTALAKYRTQVAKELLIRLTPQPWPSSDERLQRFARWLARRYGRPAIPDPIVDASQKPIVALFDRLTAAEPDLVRAFNDAVHELRVVLPPHEQPPFTLELIMLARRGRLGTAEAEAVLRLRAEICGALDPEVVTLTEDDIHLRTSDELALTDYFDSRPLYLEYLTSHGDELEGAPPLDTG